MMKATDQQQLIIDYDDSAVVIAAPGSGKTFVISQKIKKNLGILKEHEGIVAISYTNKASLELKNRSLSNGENPKNSFFGTIDKFNLSEIIIPFAKNLFGIPEAPVTIVKISSLDVEKEDNPLKWFDRNMQLEDLSGDQISILNTYYKQGFIMIETIGLLANYVFTNSLACRKYIKAKYRYIYIDEYQDSGYEQHQIFIKIYALGIKAIAVGDLNQSIYAFSGKDSRYLEDLTNNNHFKYFKLDKNHRCHASIINYSNYLLNSKTELLDVIEKNIWFHRVEGSEKAIAEWIDENLKAIKDHFKIKNNSDIGILTKSNRTGELISKNLNAPHKLSMANELDNNLNVWSAIFSNLLYFCYDQSFKFIDVVEVFSSYDRFKTTDLKKLLKLKQSIEINIISNKLDCDKLEADFIKVAKIIAPNSESSESKNLLSVVLNSDRDLKSYEPASNNELNILTLHKSKGLEYDVVIHLDLHEWIFPSKIFEVGRRTTRFSNWTQDLNLHYVGITRAKKGCFLVSSTTRTNFENKMKDGSDSEFIWQENISELRN